MSDIDIKVEHLGKRPFDWAQRLAADRGDRPRAGGGLREAEGAGGQDLKLG